MHVSSCDCAENNCHRWEINCFYSLRFVYGALFTAMGSANQDAL